MQTIMLNVACMACSKCTALGKSKSLSKDGEHGYANGSVEKVHALVENMVFCDTVQND